MNTLRTLLLIVLLTGLVSATLIVEKNVGDNPNWEVHSQSYITEFVGVEIDNSRDSIRLTLEPAVATLIEKRNYETVWGAIDKKKLAKRATELDARKEVRTDKTLTATQPKTKTDFDADIVKIDKTPMMLYAYATMREEGECEEWEAEGYDCTICPLTGSEEVLLETIDLGTIDITKPNTLNSIYTQHKNRGSRLEINIGFGTTVIVATSGAIGKSFWYFEGNSTAGTGDSWATAYTFKDAVDWFEANPYGHYWMDFIEDSRLVGFQDWYAGAFTDMLGERVAGETFIEVADNSEFTDNQNLFPIDAGYMAYAKCSTTTNTTRFDSCNFNNVYDGGSTAYARPVTYYDNETASSAIFTPFRTAYSRLMDATAVPVGFSTTNFMNGTKAVEVHSTVKRLVVMNGVKNITGYSQDAYCGHADSFIFSVWANETVTLNTTETREFSSTQGRKHDYGLIYNMSEELAPNTWHNFTIPIVDNEYGARPHTLETEAPDITAKYRGYLARRTKSSPMEISTFILTFENAKDKQILIDRAGCHSPNPAPQEIAPNVIATNIQFYCVNNIMEDTYLKDGGFTYVSYDLGRGGMYIGGKNATVMYYVQLGEDDSEEAGTVFTGWNYAGQAWGYAHGMSTARSQFVSIGANFPDFDQNRYFGQASISLPSTKLGDFNLSKMYISQLSSIFNTDRLHDIYFNPGTPTSYTTWSSSQRMNDLDIKNVIGYTPYGRITYTSSMTPAVVLKNMEFRKVTNVTYFGQFGTTVGGWVGDIRIENVAFPDDIFTRERNVYVQMRAGLTGHNYLRFVNTLHIYAEDANGTAVAGANVTMKDATGAIVFHNITDANGYLSQDFVFKEIYHQGGMRGVTTGFVDVYLWNASEYNTQPPFSLTVSDSKGNGFVLMDDFDWYYSTNGYVIHTPLADGFELTKNYYTLIKNVDYTINYTSGLILLLNSTLNNTELDITFQASTLDGPAYTNVTAGLLSVFVFVFLGVVLIIIFKLILGG